MPKFKILIDAEGYPKSAEEYHIFETRAEATKAYHRHISNLEDKAKLIKEMLHNVVENGHIVEVEDE